MRTIETTAVVAADHTLTLTLPADVPPGPCRVVVEVPEAAAPGGGDKPFPFNLEMVDLGPWPEGFTASREQLYADGR